MLQSHKPEREEKTEKQNNTAKRQPKQKQQYIKQIYHPKHTRTEPICLAADGHFGVSHVSSLLMCALQYSLKYSLRSQYKKGAHTTLLFYPNCPCPP